MSIAAGPAFPRSHAPDRSNDREQKNTASEYETALALQAATPLATDLLCEFEQCTPGHFLGYYDSLRRVTRRRRLRQPGRTQQVTTSIDEPTEANRCSNADTDVPENQRCDTRRDPQPSEFRIDLGQL
jgi:hypothetical protein